MFSKIVLGSRIVLGIFYVLSGANWFIGIIPMLPHMGMPPDLPIKHAVVVEMVNSGWMFQSAKIIELAFGISMLANRYVPLMLAATLPVAFITFMLDALILDDLMRWISGAESGADMLAAFQDMVIGGLCVLLPHLWLMWAYRGYYRPAFARRAEPQAPGDPVNPVEMTATHHGVGAWVEAPLWRRLYYALGLFAVALQAFNVYIFCSMIRL